MNEQEENATLEPNSAPSSNVCLIRPKIDKAQNVKPIGAEPTTVRPGTRPRPTVQAPNRISLTLT